MPKLHEYKPFKEFPKCQNTDDYYCKCKACGNAISRAKYIFQREIDEIKNNKAWQEKIKDCETSCGELSSQLMLEVL